jgi:hypothetical protein
MLQCRAGCTFDKTLQMSNHAQRSTCQKQHAMKVLSKSSWLHVGAMACCHELL